MLLNKTNTFILLVAFFLLQSLCTDIQLSAQPPTPPITKEPELKGVPVSIKMFYFDAAVQLPFGDLADRYGSNANVGGGIQFKTVSNWLFFADGHVLFGNTIREDSLAINLGSSQNFIVGNDGLNADVTFLQRGFTVAAGFGRVVPLTQRNPNSGIKITLKGGFMQHKIRIEDKQNVIPQLRGEYAKGYDRLCTGFFLSQFIGYQHFGRKRGVNYFLGVDVSQGFTYERRPYFFDTRQFSQDEPRLDILLGFRLGFIIPFNRKEGLGQYYIN